MLPAVFHQLANADLIIPDLYHFVRKKYRPSLMHLLSVYYSRGEFRLQQLIR